MEKGLCALLFSLVLLTAASAQEAPEAVFDMDSSGNAQMSIVETLDLFAEDISILASVGQDGTISFAGTIVEETSPVEPDYNIEIASEGSSADISFMVNGGYISDMVAELGDFDLRVRVKESGGTLIFEMDGTIERKMIDEIEIIDLDSMLADLEGTKAMIEGEVNELFSLLDVGSEPKMSIDELSIIGTDILSVRVKILVQGWSEFMAAVLAMTYAEQEVEEMEGLSFLTCLAGDLDSIVSSALGTEVDLTMDISGSGSSISGSMSAVTGNAASSASIESLDMKYSKSGSTISMSGSAMSNDVKGLTGCMVREYVSGDYDVENIEYSLVKSGEAEALQSLEGKINRLARASGEGMVISFPEDTISYLNVRVSVPSGMEIKAVSGGEKTGREASSSGTGEAFTITYGKAEAGVIGGLDTNMLIVIVIIVLIVMLLAIRRKK